MYYKSPQALHKKVLAGCWKKPALSSHRRTASQIIPRKLLITEPRELEAVKNPGLT